MIFNLIMMLINVLKHSEELIAKNISNLLELLIFV